MPVAVGLVVGNGESVWEPATAREESLRLNTKNSTCSSVEVAAARRRASGQQMVFGTVWNPWRPM